MHSIAIVSVLAAAAGLTAAAPANNQPRSGQYVCASNGFNGICSVDACNLPWCPDYQLYTYIPIVQTNTDPNPVPVVPAPKPFVDETVCPSGTGYFQSCGTNGFRGCCKSDACGGAWCPDYKPGSYTPVNTWTVRTRSDPTVCAAGTGYFQSCGTNGFRGCCKSDACGAAWCADYKIGTYELIGSSTGTETPVVKPETPVVKPETPVVKPETPVVKPAAGWTDPTVCAPGTGYFQKCSNGFVGCCKQDACSIGWCPTN